MLSLMHIDPRGGPGWGLLMELPGGGYVLSSPADRKGDREDPELTKRIHVFKSWLVLCPLLFEENLSVGPAVQLYRPVLPTGLLTFFRLGV